MSGGRLSFSESRSDLKYAAALGELLHEPVIGGNFTAAQGGVILVGGRPGMCCLVGVSACMSLMFPTIYGIALGDVHEDTEVGSAGLIMAILGGSLLPAAQAMIIDSHVTLLPPVNLSFIVPAVCFVVVLLYGLRQS